MIFFSPVHVALSNNMPTDHTYPSVCIPRVFANVTKQDVREVFEQVLGSAGPGCIERVDLISRTDQNGTPFGRVFIHFRHWPQTPQAQGVRDMLMRGEQVKIVYDEPWFWKCGMSRVPKPELTRERTAPYVAVPVAATGVVSSGDDALSAADTVEATEGGAVLGRSEA